MVGMYGCGDDWVGSIVIRQSRYSVQQLHWSSSKVTALPMYFAVQTTNQYWFVSVHQRNKMAGKMRYTLMGSNRRISLRMWTEIKEYGDMKSTSTHWNHHRAKRKLLTTKTRVRGVGWGGKWLYEKARLLWKWKALIPSVGSDAESEVSSPASIGWCWWWHPSLCSNSSGPVR